ncbi:glycosyltransferase family 2 protein [uncultured Sphingomonas sp.]|uniref:glycosyltransferase family 2 protein n=1 Tax=uncultured Sphingomonas sp. TaxID=158754 RepID=UPI0035CB6007
MPQRLHPGKMIVDASIIIPTYNRLWSLPDAIASCPRDTGTEIIVVDDGSTDGTWEWLATQPGLRAIRQANWGKPAAANAGFEAARGCYVRFLDSDDLLIPDAARAQLAHALAEQPDICVAGYVARYEDGGREELHDWIDCGDFLAQQLGECDSSHYSAYLFRRDFLAGIRHRPEYRFRDDRMFVLECALRGPRVATWRRPTLVHRHHDRGRIQFQPGSTLIVTNWQELEMWKKIAALLDADGELTDRRRAAMANNVWPLALRIAARSRREGHDAVDWLRRLAPSFRIPHHGIQNRLYRRLGYGVAQPVANIVLTLRNAVRGAAAMVRR